MSTAKITDTALYLTFRLGDEVFAHNVKQVREVLDLAQITKVPQAPDFMRGVINLRGSVVPVVDIKMKFGLPKTDRIRSLKSNGGSSRKTGWAWGSSPGSAFRPVTMTEGLAPEKPVTTCFSSLRRKLPPGGFI